eukprot:TRINITY_DN2788_c0_g4_i1.p2 TRINITY_DN2788_c0_g4~~TRINITY_DN2788_c0_g4_i1.p2  ORF type:complete len:139 (-),score=17.15 TRINITY_DN2788_c0_g4_i1:474-830(-)
MCIRDSNISHIQPQGRKLFYRYTCSFYLSLKEASAKTLKDNKITIIEPKMKNKKCHPFALVKHCLIRDICFLEGRYSSGFCPIRNRVTRMKSLKASNTPVPSFAEVSQQGNPIEVAFI